MEELYELMSSTSSKTKSATHVIARFISLINSLTQQSWQGHIEKYLHCTLKVLSLCDNCLQESNICEWKQRYNYRIVQTFYFHSLNILFSMIGDEVTNVVITIVHEENFWQSEDLCHHIIEGLINCGINEYKVINALSSKVQCGTSLKDSRQMLLILSTTLADHLWVDPRETEAALKTLSSLYNDNLNLHPNNKKIILVNGYGLCMLNIVKHLANSHLLTLLSHFCLWTLEEQPYDDELILEVSNVLEFVAECYEMELLEKTLEKDLFFTVLKMISSTNSSVSLVGNRVLQNLIDRNHNKLQFQSIQIFFENTNYDIKINKHNYSDQLFLKNQRERIHDSFMQCVINHCSSRINLEAMYCTICLIAAEVPCGLTAATLACLVMSIQDVALEHLELTLEHRAVTYHIHVAVLAIMTLICWIHNAKVFYVYVNNVLIERAKWAPHLNVPLATYYNYAIHHVLWDKPELFFIDWEVRFGLWKCFRQQTEEDHNKIQ